MSKDAERSEGKEADLRKDFVTTLLVSVAWIGIIDYFKPVLSESWQLFGEVILSLILMRLVMTAYFIGRLRGPSDRFIQIRDAFDAWEEKWVRPPIDWFHRRLAKDSRELWRYICTVAGKKEYHKPAAIVALIPCIFSLLFGYYDFLTNYSDSVSGGFAWSTFVFVSKIFCAGSLVGLGYMLLVALDELISWFGSSERFQKLKRRGS